MSVAPTPIPVDHVRITVATLLRHAACHLPEDVARALRWGHDQEESPLGRSIFRTLLQNAVAASAAGRPTCQDTGQAVVFVDLGQDVHLLGGSLEDAIQAGVAEGYRAFRKSVVRDALFDRRNTGDNTPAVIHVRVVPGRQVTLHVMEKGYGSENKCVLRMYPYPQGGEDAVVDVVRGAIEKAGADWCPPGFLSVAIGGSFEQAPLLAKRALLEPFDMDRLLDREASDPGSLTPTERLRIRLFREVNGLGLGPQGLGGVRAVLDVKVTTAPTHIAGLPIALAVQCNKAHHLSAVLTGEEPVTSLPVPDLAAFLPPGPEPTDGVRRLTVPLDPADARSLVAGERVLLTGRILSARDAAHKRMVDALDRGEPLPVDLRGQLIYYVGPVDPVPGEIIGPAGPTTASRMDPYHPRLLRETGLGGAIGKSERGPEVVEAIRETGTVYFIAIGGAAYLQARSVRATEVLAWPDLGPEAIRALDVVDFPAIVAVDSRGVSFHQEARFAWCRGDCGGCRAEAGEAGGRR